MKLNIGGKVLFVLLIFNGRSNPSILATKQIHDTFSYLCQDQMVKVDSNIYHMDRLNASLKSEYFEKLFTSEDFKRKNDPIIEVQPLNSEVFPAILEIINGKEIRDVLFKPYNCFSLLKEMNHFGMKIDLQCFSDWMQYFLKDAEVCELYAFVTQNNQQFGYLLKSVLKCLSDNLHVLQNHEILSSDMPLDHLIRIIENIQFPNENTTHYVTQLCSNWLCHDMKNRLPRMGQLARKTKSLYRGSEDMYTYFSKCLTSCNLDKQARQEMISTCFSALVANAGYPYDTTPEYSYDSCDRYYSRVDPRSGSETETEEYEKYVNDRNDCDKLNEFRKNGELYDITVRVGEKTYKLHRHVLESKSGYFRDIFQAEYAEATTQCGGTPTTCPSKDKEYLLSDEIDPTTFEDVLNGLYGYNKVYTIFKRFEYKWFMIAQFLKITQMLQLHELLDDSIRDLNEEHQIWSSQDDERILNFAHGVPEYDDLYALHLSKHLAKNWPNIRNMSQFCTISWPVLKKMLNSSYFRFDDPHKVLDICSKWTCHDVRSRYRFLPQIGRIINPLCVVKDDDYTTYAVADFNTSPEKFVRDELWKILSSPPHIISSEKYFKNTSRKLEEIPVFISVMKEKNINVLNTDLDVITSINNCGPIYSVWKSSSTGQNDPFLATLINDNLFILSNYGGSYKFMVYNFFLKTYIQLHCDLPRPSVFLRRNGPFYTLLNCNNDVYICSNYGRIAKYSMQFDLWTTLIKQDPHSYKENLHYTSDGKTLYRIYVIPGTLYQYGVEELDLTRYSWNRVPGSPLTTLTKYFYPNPTCFSMINDRDFVIFVDDDVITSNRDVTGKEWHWSYHKIPNTNKRIFSFAQYEDKLLVLTNDDCYRYYANNGSFEFKKAIPEDLRFGGPIVTIGRHVHADTIEELIAKVALVT
ncbi:uncharacterized protein LOC135831689 [Planococcus citri]|uniref:uncharacterized protein LOC135831689 n=1 Tax=Planococcus citri TaxID=170843 RepID=UPI0031F92326